MDSISISTTSTSSPPCPLSETRNRVRERCGGRRSPSPAKSAVTRNLERVRTGSDVGFVCVGAAIKEIRDGHSHRATECGETRTRERRRLTPPGVAGVGAPHALLFVIISPPTRQPCWQQGGGSWWCICAASVSLADRCRAVPTR